MCASGGIQEWQPYRIVRDRNVEGLSQGWSTPKGHGHASFESGENKTTWHPGQGTFSATGEAIVSTVASGVIDFTVRGSLKAKAEAFQSALLPPESTMVEQFRDKLKPYLPAEDVEGTVREIVTGGWDAAWKIYHDRSLQAQREWCAATGKSRYGVNVASDWRPDNWLADYDHLTVQSAESDIVALREELGALQQVYAISQVEYSRAEEAKDSLPGLKRAYEQIVEAHGETVMKSDAVRSRQVAEKKVTLELQRKRMSYLGKIRDLEATEGERCPHCGEHLIVESNKIVKFDCDVAKRKVVKIRQEIAALDGQLEKMIEKDIETDRELKLFVDQLSKERPEVEDAAVCYNSAKNEAKNLINASVDTTERQHTIEQLEQKIDGREGGS